jgi:SAM-dependent methyltransferase
VFVYRPCSSYPADCSFDVVSLYDYPKYYDLVFGSDWKAEFDFLRASFERYLPGRVRHVLEPACGTGRLMVKLAGAGYNVHGFDLNARAVEYCNRRLARHGFAATAFVADMSDFRPPRKFDVAFNLINSFRHLQSEAAAEAHLRCVAAALRPGGLYLLGLHLTPLGQQRCREESWSARRGHLAVNSHMWSISVDPRRRQERLGMTFDVFTPSRYFQLAEEMFFRTYTAEQFARLLARVGKYQVLATYDFAYDINLPLQIGPETEDVVFVMRRR